MPRAIAFRPDRRRLLGAAGAAALLAPLRTVRAETGITVDLALVLAADCSGSVQTDHYVLQQRGYADAFRDPAVIRAIGSGVNGRIAACYFQWSGYGLQTLLQPWTLLHDKTEIAVFATALERAERTLYGGGTAPAGAMRFGRDLLDHLVAGDRPLQALRRVIDISGDGRTNVGPAPGEERTETIAAGITINGLPILHMEPDIDDYYEREIIGGNGAFLVPARDFNAFREAIRRKLIQEIAGILPIPA
ncbi:DUF1194 domain-containing protein [Ferrovibrio xuzhouensis]|uniref:DUF1194 domain-containing protein n=1 Tax=Ferrovibrio xuzhouensis TaxID=1576914 RepID=A0ABV7VIB5_9PROT